MDKIEKIPIPEDVKRVLDNVSHILIGLNYRETARDYKQAVEKLISLLEAEEPDKSLEEAARHSEILTYPMPEDGDIEKVMKVQEARIFHEIGFKAGDEWQKQQMLKVAMEGVLVDNIDGTQDICFHGNRFGQKARIVVLKEEE